MRFPLVLILVLLFACLFEIHAGTPPEFLWAKGGGSISDDHGNSIAVDAAGNSIVTGRFTGNASFLGTNMVSRGQDEIYLMKLNSSGGRVWLKQAGGTNTDEAYSTSLDSLGNIYIAGRFTSTATFGTTNLTSAGTHDMFLAKYDMNGNFLWARRGGGTNVDYANAVCTDAFGNVFVTGIFSSSATFGSAVLTSGGNRDIFVVKYDPAGNLLWANSFGTASDDVGFSIASDSAGNVFVSGWLIEAVTFAGKTVNPLGAQDIFLAKYDFNGIAQWLRRAGGSAAYDYCYSVAVDALGNPYICGSFRSTATFGNTNLTSSGSTDIVLAKYDTAGNFLWAQKAGSSTGDDEAYSVAIDQAGNAFLTGYFRGTASFSGTNITSSGQHDLFIANYDSTGTFKWVQKGGGTNYEYGNSIALDSLGNAFVAGTFFSSATFGTNVVASVGGSDFLVTKLRTLQALNNPTISDITDKILNEDTTSGSIPFTVSDAETSATNLTIAASSSNPTLLPSIVLGGTGTNRTVTISPATNLFGTATVTIQVTDSDGMTNSDSFIVTVNPVNDAPTLTAISNIIIDEDSGNNVVSIGGITSGASNENQALTVTATSSNPVLISNPSVSYVSANATGSLSFTPIANANGTSTITVTVQDDGGTGNGGSNRFSRTFLVTVNPVNDPPTISQIAPQTIEKNTSTASLPFVIGDVETAATSLSVSGNSSNTGLIPNANIIFGGSGNNRTVTVSPATGQIGSATITIAVNDGTVSVTTSFLVTVNEVNFPPTISQIPDQTINEDTPTGAIPFTVDDLDGLAGLILSVDSSNTNLVPNANVVFGGSGASRTVTIAPALNQTGSATVTISVGDGVTNATSSFLVTVNPVNDAPTISQIASQTIEKNTSTASLPFVIGDVETAATSLSVSGNSSNTGLIPNANIVFGGSGASRTVTIAPALNQTGSATITIVVNDGTTNQSSSFLVTVNPVNDFPTISLITNQVTNEDAPTAAIPFTVSDTETAATSLIVSATSSNTTLVPNANIVLGGSGTNRTLVITPASNQFGTSVITVSVSDGLATTNTSFLLTVNSVNDAPTLNPLNNVVINEDAGTNLSLSGITSGVSNESQVLTVTATSSNPSLMANPVVSYTSPNGTGSLSLAPLTNANGSATITVTVQDDGGTANGGTNSFARTFLVTVNPVNDAPTISRINDQTIRPNTSTGSLPFLISDAETAATNLVVSRNSSDTRLIPIANVVLGGSGSNRTITITPAVNKTGSATITISVNDGSTTVSGSFLVTVTSSNSAPTIGPIANRITNEDAPTAAIPFTVSDTETAATSLIVSATSSNTTLVPNANIVLGGSGTNRTLVITPASNQFGTSVITVSVSDGLATTNTSFLLTVNSVNDAPTLNPLNNVVINEDSGTNLSLSGITSGASNESQVLTVTATSSNPSLMANPVVIYTSPNGTGSLSLAPLTNANGLATITVTVQDAGGIANGGTNSFARTFLVTVNPVNDAPVPTPVGTQVVNEETLLLVTNFATDVDSPANTLTFSLLSPPPGASITSSGVFSWIPTEAQGPSTNVISVRVTDDGTPSLSSTNSFTVIVNEVNKAPIISTPPSFTIDVGKVFFLTNSAVDNDVPANLVTYFLVAAPQGATITPQGVFSWTPSANQAASTNVIQVRASDNGIPTLSSTNSFVIVVSPLNAVELLQIQNPSYISGRTKLYFNAQAGQTYRIDYAPVLNARWFELKTVAAQLVTTNLVVSDEADDTNRFYRLVLAELPLRIDRFIHNSQGLQIFFAVEGGRTYQVETRSSLTTGSWVVATNFTAAVTTNSFSYFDSRKLSQQFYRLVLAEPPLRIDRITRNVQGQQIFFAVVGGRTYQVETRESLTAGSWSVATNFTAGVSNSSFSYLDSSQLSQRFYRLSIPARLSEFSKIEKLPAQFSFQFNAQAALNYTVEYIPNLTTNVWTFLTNLTPALVTNVSVTDNSATGSQRFYRVRID